MEDNEDAIETIFGEREWTSEELSAELKKGIVFRRGILTPLAG